MSSATESGTTPGWCIFYASHIIEGLLAGDEEKARAYANHFVRHLIERGEGLKANRILRAMNGLPERKAILCGAEDEQDPLRPSLNFFEGVEESR